jgi:hypothetical protein
MNPNLNSLILLMAVMGNRDRDDRLLQFLLITTLLGASVTPSAAGTTSPPATTVCPPANQCDMTLMLLALTGGFGGGGLFGRRDRDHDRDRDRDRDRPWERQGGGPTSGGTSTGGSAHT